MLHYSLVTQTAKRESSAAWGDSEILKMQIVYRLEVHFSYFSLCCVIESRKEKWNWFDVKRDSVMTLEHQQYVCLKQKTQTMFIELFGLTWKSFRRRSLLGLFKVHVASFKSEKLNIPNIVWLRRWLCYTSGIFTPSHHYRRRRRLSVCKKKKSCLTMKRMLRTLFSRLVGRRALEKRWSC